MNVNSNNRQQLKEFPVLYHITQNRLTQIGLTAYNKHVNSIKLKLRNTGQTKKKDVSEKLKKMIYVIC
jgi:hypothetical protein